MNWLFHFGCMGVELFFVISGFVIFLTIEKTKTSTDFLRSRFARLYPAYWTCVTITTISMIVYGMMVKQPVTFPTLKDYLLNLSMVQSYFKIQNIDGAYWTLVIEMQFYVFILVVFLLNKTNKIEAIGLVFTVLCLISRFVHNAGCDFISDYCLLFTYFPLFFLGILFYKVKFYRPTIFRFLLIAVAITTQIILYHDDGRNKFVSQAEYSVVIVAISIIFTAYCFDKIRFIVITPLVFLGKISYSLYLIHDIVGGLFVSSFSRSRILHFNFWITMFFIALPAVIALAALINKYVEVPANAYIKTKLIIKKKVK